MRRFLLLFCLIPHLAWAQSLAGSEPVSKPVMIFFVLFVLSLAPFILMMTTSFIKISVVLSLLRQAIGTQQIPPNPVITGLALVLTIYVMLPVAQKIYDQAQDQIHQGAEGELLSLQSVDVLKSVIDKGKEPMREFLDRHTHDRERKLFLSMAQKLKATQGAKLDLTSKDFAVLIPGFILSELSESFQIGFIIFLPFLVIDMVVSNILLSMGMFQLSPVTVSLPFKLLLFVMVDGWYLIVEGLVNSYLR